MDQNFVDHVKINCKSGNGGSGSSYLRREKFSPRGGPDGGDGGRGGHIILRGNGNLWTLLHLKYRKHVHAKHGGAGGSSQKFGSDGDDMILEVPLGTVATDSETGERILEVMNEGQEVILVEGGKGGRGNVHFKNSVRQTPTYAQPGLEGSERWITLELKVLADVGLVGFPNAGKSTLLSAVSAAKPKIASYAFTTLIPNLGIVSYREGRSFIMADIPGIIENAHQGKGLGLRFLRHIERNSCLLFMIPVDEDDINHAFEVLYNELAQYNPELLDKPRLLALTKSDMIDEELEKEMMAEISIDIDYCFISSITGKGLNVLKDKIWNVLNEE